MIELCRQCESPFHVAPGRSIARRRKFCSKDCRRADRVANINAPEMYEAVEQASRLHPHLVLCQCTEVEPCYPRLLVTLLAKASAS